MQYLIIVGCVLGMVGIYILFALRRTELDVGDTSYFRVGDIMSCEIKAGKKQKFKIVQIKRNKIIIRRKLL